MRQVVLAVNDGTGVPKFPFEMFGKSKLGREPTGHPLNKLGETPRERSEMAEQQTLKLNDGFVVKGDAFYLIHRDSSTRKKPFNRVYGKSGIVLFAAKFLLTGSGNGDAIVQQASC